MAEKDGVRTKEHFLRTKVMTFHPLLILQVYNMDVTYGFSSLFVLLSLCDSVFSHPFFFFFFFVWGGEVFGSFRLLPTYLTCMLDNFLICINLCYFLQFSVLSENRDVGFSFLSFCGCLLLPFVWHPKFNVEPAS